MLIKFTYIDAITGIAMSDHQCENGPILPVGAVIGFTNESQWPCDYPIFYGNGEMTAGVFEVITQATYDEEYLLELNRRQEIIDNIIQDKISQLWSAANTYTTNYISGVAIGLLPVGLILQKPKALAVIAWSNSIWAVYYQRKATTTPTSELDLDFTFAGPMPHSVPELQAEVGL
jgi:hypothetical protein